MTLDDSSKSRFLTPGDTIGVLALSSPCNPERISKGIEHLKAQGFKVKVALDPAAAYGKDTFLFASDTPEKRAAALTDLFVDDSVKVIISARGAYGSAEILPHLDFKKISKHPKPLVGFSDVTALLVPLVEKGKIPAIHGPMVSGALAEAENDSAAAASVAKLLGLLSGEISNPLKDITLTKLKEGKNQEGFILGGSLSTLVSLLGTPWEPELHNAILFLEEKSERPYKIHRMLLQLKQAGKLDKLSGMLLGDFIDCEHASGPDVWAVIKSVVQGFDFPVFSGMPSGHGKLNLPILFGKFINIDTYASIL